MSIQSLIDAAKKAVGFPKARAGGTDRWTDYEILDWLNDGFDAMVGEVGGLEAYAEFTITAGGVIAVTKPGATQNPPTIAANNPPLADYGLFRISDALSYVKFRNMTAGLNDDQRRILIRRSINDPLRQEIYNNAQDYYDSYDLIGTSGFALMPFTVNTTNTVGVGYKKKFRRLNFSEPIMHGAGVLNDLTLEGVYTGKIDRKLRIQMDGGTNPQTFRYSWDDGVTWTASTVAMSLIAISIGYGITVKWGAVTGHTLLDYWNSDVNVSSLADFDDVDQRGYPLLWAAYNMARDIRDVDRDVFLRDANIAKQSWIDGRFYSDRTLDFSLDNPVRGTVRERLL